MAYQGVAYVVYKAQALMFLGQLFLVGLHSFIFSVASTATAISAEGLSIGEITRRLNAEGVSIRKASARWERSEGVGGVAQPRPSGCRLFRQDARFCACSD